MASTPNSPNALRAVADVSDEELRTLVTHYLKYRWSLKRIVEVLKLQDRIQIAYQTLKNKSMTWQLPTSRRFDKEDTDLVETVAEIITAEKESGAWRDDGYRTIVAKLAAEPYCLNVPEDVVRDMLPIIDAQGVAARKRKKFRQAQQPFISPGVNECWSMDGHDKMNAFGLSLYMIIDEDSQAVLRFQVWKGNKSPQVPVKLYLSAVKELQMFPFAVKFDHGTETPSVSAAHLLLHQQFNTVEYQECEQTEVIRHVGSTANIRVEGAWSHYRFQLGIRLTDQIQARIALQIYDPHNHLHRVCFLAIAIPAIQRELDKLVERWNYVEHRRDTKKQKNARVPRILRWKFPEHYESAQCGRRVNDMAFVQQLSDEFAPDTNPRLILFPPTTTELIEHVLEELEVNPDAELNFFSDEFWTTFESIRDRVQDLTTNDEEILMEFSSVGNEKDGE